MLLIDKDEARSSVISQTIMMKVPTPTLIEGYFPFEEKKQLCCPHQGEPIVGESAKNGRFISGLSGNNHLSLLQPPQVADIKRSRAPSLGNA
jgi:hypothetical protein